jgi:hypothetical protein
MKKRYSLVHLLTIGETSNEILQSDLLNKLKEMLSRLVDVCNIRY